MIDLNDLATWELIASILKRDRVLRQLHVVTVVLRNGAHLLLQASDVLGVILNRYVDSLKLRNQLVCHIVSCHLELDHGVRESISFEDWHCVGDTLSRLSDEAADLSGGVHAEGSGVHDLEALDFEVLEHDLSHLLTVILCIEWRIGHEKVHILCLEVELIKDV